MKAKSKKPPITPGTMIFLRPSEYYPEFIPGFYIILEAAKESKYSNYYELDRNCWKGRHNDQNVIYFPDPSIDFLVIG